MTEKKETQGQQQMTDEENKARTEELENKLAYGMLVGMTNEGQLTFSIHSKNKDISELAMLENLSSRLIQGEIDKEFPNYATMLARKNSETLARILGIVGGIATVIDGLRDEIDDLNKKISGHTCACENEEEEDKLDEQEKTTNQTSTENSQE